MPVDVFGGLGVFLERVVAHGNVIGGASSILKECCVRSRVGSNSWIEARVVRSQVGGNTPPIVVPAFKHAWCVGY